MEIPIAGLPAWMVWSSVSLNGCVLMVGAWAIAHRGGWSYVRDRLWHPQPLPDHQLHAFPYYAHRRSQLDLLPIQPSDIVFLGDSITDEGEWSEWFPGLPIRNRGISADTTTGVLRRLKPILDGSPATLFLMIGHNDLAAQGKTPERVLQHYEQILQRLKDHIPHTQVYVQSVLPVAQRPPELNLNIQRVNQGLKALAPQLGYTYLDLYTVFLENDQLNPAYTTDGVHLNGHGYALWARQIQAMVTVPLRPGT